MAFKQFQFGTNHKPHETERARDREASERERHLLNSLKSTQMYIQLLDRREGEKERKNKMRRDSVLCACMTAFIKIFFYFFNH